MFFVIGFLKEIREESTVNRLRLSGVVIDLLRQSKRIIIHPSGNSMSPIFWDGDEILIKTLAPEEIRIGDIVAFASPFTMMPNVMVIHRVVWIKKHHADRIFITKGDNSHGLDPPVYGHSIIGKVVCVQYKEGGGIYFENVFVRLLNFVWTLMQPALCFSKIFLARYRVNMINKLIFRGGKIYVRVLTWISKRQLYKCKRQ